MSSREPPVDPHAYVELAVVEREAAEEQTGRPEAPEEQTARPEDPENGDPATTPQCPGLPSPGGVPGPPPNPGPAAAPTLAPGLPLPPAFVNQADFMARQERILKRLDASLMPFLSVVYICMQLDRILFALHKPSFTRELGLTEDQYKYTAIAQETGLAVLQVPSALLTNHLNRPKIFLCFALAAWSAVQLCSPFVINFVGLIICRSMIGILESALCPATFHFMTSFGCVTRPCPASLDRPTSFRTRSVRSYCTGYRMTTAGLALTTTKKRMTLFKG
ncbi:hypothetical protein GGS23DRAFT_437809 [Durotheca rogersii]|uniref:uncharacterized protein n=1 Tax=Durotheca rogersii TaxID=419775 RepID=UPI00221F8A33|nr:uncharacterized protein GGS23DRAFT_437809 [Durotheca rogersii]KAI5856144.1 hypothetical protein GGS23DRAFT_437809 [Durotheca rogersii]